MKTVAIVDADPLCYLIAITAPEIVEVEPEVYIAKMSGDRVRARLAAWAADIKRELRADALEFCFTDRKDNFRLDYFSGYKGNRPPAAKPLFLKQVTDIAIDEFNGWLWDRLEGDDLCGILMTSDEYYPDHHKVAVSIDKDLATIPGWHYNPNNRDRGVIEVTKQDAEWFHLLQSLMGDATDGYPGCPKFGKILATRKLNEWIEKGLDPWAQIVACYAKEGLDEEFALSMARCAKILDADHFDFDTMSPKAWNPPAWNPEIEPPKVEALKDGETLF